MVSVFKMALICILFHQTHFPVQHAPITEKLLALFDCTAQWFFFPPFPFPPSPPYVNGPQSKHLQPGLPPFWRLCGFRVHGHQHQGNVFSELASLEGY